MVERDGNGFASSDAIEMGYVLGAQAYASARQAYASCMKQANDE